MAARLQHVPETEPPRRFAGRFEILPEDVIADAQGAQEDERPTLSGALAELFRTPLSFARQGVGGPSSLLGLAGLAAGLFALIIALQTTFSVQHSARAYDRGLQIEAYDMAQAITLPPLAQATPQSLGSAFDRGLARAESARVALLLSPEGRILLARARTNAPAEGVVVGARLTVPDTQIAARARTGEYQLVLLATEGWRRALSDHVPLALIALAMALFALAAISTGLIRMHRSLSRRTQEAERTLGDVVRAAEQAGSGLWRIREDGCDWSGLMFELLGYSSGAGWLSLSDLSALAHPEDAAALLRTLEQGSGHVIVRLRHKAGQWRDIDLTLVPAADEDEALAVGIARDITAQRKAEAALGQGHANLAEALAGLPSAVAVFDAEDRLVLANARFADLHGLNPAALVPGVPRARLKAAARHPASALSADTVKPIAAGHVERAGERWLHVCVKRLPGGGSVCAETDITALKTQEQRLLDSEAKLQATVRELESTRFETASQAARMRDLAERYQREKTRAEEANRTKTEFLAHMSHELRTPLNAVIGFSEVMTNEMFGPLGHEKYTDYAADIRESGAHLLSLIDDILDMATIEAGRMEIAGERFDPAQVIEDAVRLIAPKAGAKDLTLSVQTDRCPMIVGDARALKQVLVNLLSNAVKFTPPGGEVALIAEADLESLRLRVEDTGIGIAAQDLPRLGKPFMRIGSPETAGEPGTGLGLALAKSLTELMGGTLTIHSIEHEGTCVVLNLPRHTAASASQPARKAS